ncbi:MAG: hypothetical protein AB7G80_03460 [Dongiaceae bacterium]
MSQASVIKVDWAGEVKNLKDLALPSQRTLVDFEHLLEQASPLTRAEAFELIKLIAPAMRWLNKLLEAAPDNLAPEFCRSFFQSLLGALIWNSEAGPHQQVAVQAVLEHPAFAVWPTPSHFDWGIFAPLLNIGSLTGTTKAHQARVAKSAEFLQPAEIGRLKTAACYMLKSSFIQRDFCLTSSSYAAAVAGILYSPRWDENEKRRILEVALECTRQNPARTAEDFERLTNFYLYLFGPIGAVGVTEASSQARQQEIALRRQEGGKTMGELLFQLPPWVLTEFGRRLQTDIWAPCSKDAGKARNFYEDGISDHSLQGQNQAAAWNAAYRLSLYAVLHQPNTALRQSETQLLLNFLERYPVPEGVNLNRRNNGMYQLIRRRQVPISFYNLPPSTTPQLSRGSQNPGIQR